jgi:hypothetical protein
MCPSLTKAKKKIEKKPMMWGSGELLHRGQLHFVAGAT